MATAIGHSLCESMAVEAGESLLLSVETFEHVEQFRDHEEVVQPLGDADQLDGTAPVLAQP